MKVLFLSTYDTLGGACRGARKLFRALNEETGLGVEARMLVQEKFGDDRFVSTWAGMPWNFTARWRKEFDLRPLRKQYPDRLRIPFSVNRTPGGLARKARQTNSDLVHLHWVNAGFVNIDALRRMNAPLLWTFRDMWPLTGGCHYAGECDRFTKQCGRCPVLRSGEELDLSRKIFERKAKAWKGLGIHVVAPCRWMEAQARRSALFGEASITVIPNGVDVDTFSPKDREQARSELGLPLTGRIVLFGAQHALADARKGFAHLVNAFKRLRSLGDSADISLLVFGADLNDADSLPFPVRSLGVIDDDRKLAAAYAAADVFCSPSLEENMANTVLEALSCGVPVVAFRIGGMPDMIEHGVNGLLAKPLDDEDLALALARVSHAGPEFGKAARAIALKRFDIRIIASKYAKLYEEILERKQENRKRLGRSFYHTL